MCSRRCEVFGWGVGGYGGFMSANWIGIEVVQWMWGAAAGGGLQLWWLIGLI